MFENLRDKRILVTGHTGFKGSWLVKLLYRYTSRIYGFSLGPCSEESLYEMIGISNYLWNEYYCDILDFEKLAKYIAETKPDVIFHLAAQSLVCESYRRPLGTFNVNAGGTANLLEAVRVSGISTVVVCVTTDKVYENNESGVPFAETNPLGGYDPYSASKAAAEIIIQSYRKSFFNPDDYDVKHNVQLASARAGNVIGGGDFAENRIVPDIYRAVKSGKNFVLRHPESVRPWQYVVEPLIGYMTLAEKMLGKYNPEYSSAWNFGPSQESFITAKQLAEKAFGILGRGHYEEAKTAGVHEAGVLKLDSSKAMNELGWTPKTGIDRALANTFDWYKVLVDGQDVNNVINRQIDEYGI